MNETDLREALQFAYCLSYESFQVIFGTGDTPYAKDKFKTMQHDFSRWYCGLDNLNSKKFILAFRPDRGDKKLIESGAMCSQCGSKEPIMYEKTSIVCGYCRGNK